MVFWQALHASFVSGIGSVHNYAVVGVVTSHMLLKIACKCSS
jgi:hypothetical protein